MKFKHWNCDIEVKEYKDGRPAIILTDKVTSEKIATATVYADVELTKGHTLIKNYSENEGMLKALVDFGVVEDTGITHASGFVDLHEVKILPF